MIRLFETYLILDTTAIMKLRMFLHSLIKCQGWRIRWKEGEEGWRSYQNMW